MPRNSRTAFIEVDEYYIAVNIDLNMPFNVRVEYSTASERFELQLYPSQTQMDPNAHDTLFYSDNEDEVKEAHGKFVYALKAARRNASP